MSENSTNDSLRSPESNVEGRDRENGDHTPRSSGRRKIASRRTATGDENDNFDDDYDAIDDDNGLPQPSSNNAASPLARTSPIKVNALRIIPNRIEFENNASDVNAASVIDNVEMHSLAEATANKKEREGLLKDIHELKDALERSKLIFEDFKAEQSQDVDKEGTLAYKNCDEVFNKLVSSGLIHAFRIDPETGEQWQRAGCLAFFHNKDVLLQATPGLGKTICALGSFLYCGGWIFVVPISLLLAEHEEICKKLKGKCFIHSSCFSSISLLICFFFFNFF